MCEAKKWKVTEDKQNVAQDMTSSNICEYTETKREWPKTKWDYLE